jgi:virginiamycin B lyase
MLTSRRSTFILSLLTTLLVLPLSSLRTAWVSAIDTTNPAVSSTPGRTTYTMTEFPLQDGLPSNITPHRITPGPDGNLWFTVDVSNRIWRMTPDGTFTTFVYPPGSSQPNHITQGPDGNLWYTRGVWSAPVPGHHAIGRITTTGETTEFMLSPGSNPVGITAGPDGALWFTESSANKIGRITTDGVIIEFELPTVNSIPTDIAVGPDGALWFTQWGGSKIGRITTDGVITEFALPTAGSRPQSITAGPDEALWFTQRNGDGIGRISVTGEVTEYSLTIAVTSPQGQMERSGLQGRAGLDE